LLIFIPSIEIFMMLNPVRMKLSYVGKYIEQCTLLATKKSLNNVYYNDF